ncbi:MAG: aldo/keto reductase [Spirochaetaceae bacterium]|jgi:2,5-diketo-D-gluconate reductase B|nr:aldo/keto reductase [Spirochaetaceae bacterium]
MHSILLKSGNSIPQIGLGTWQLSGEDCSNAVNSALVMGYDHIDTAVAYANHKDVARGIKDSGKKRNSFFLTTKIPLETSTYDEVLKSAKKSLDELRVDYVDLLLIHWPNKSVPFSETLEAFNELRNRGLTKDIGISNFNAEITAEAVELSQAPLVVNQVEFHPLLFQKDLYESCKKVGVEITAYSPLARGKIFENDILKDIAAKNNASIAQVSISWLMSKGIIVIPKASSLDHLKNNLAARNLELSTEDLQSIDSIEETYRMVDGSWKHYEF